MAVVRIRKARAESGSRRWIRADSLRTLDAIVGDDARLDALIAEHGLKRSVIDRPGAVIPANQMAGLLETLAARLAIPDIGMQLAERQRASATADPVDLVIFNAPTLRDAFLFGERHVSYYSPAVRFEMATGDPEGDVRFHYRFEADDIAARQATEYGCLSACINIINLADARPREVWFRHGRMSPLARYEAAFRAPVSFDMPIDAIAIGRVDFVKPIVDRDERLYHVGMEISERRQAQSKPLSAHLHAEIERLLPERKCSYDMICEQIGISPRTMRRYLELEDTSFTDLKDMVRRHQVRQALARPGLRRSDLARHAGYYDPASIRRNIGRWV